MGIQIMLTILWWCESPQQQNQDNKTYTTEVNDTTHIKQLAYQFDSIGREAFSKQDQMVAIPNFMEALHYYEQLGDKKKEQIINKNIAIGHYQQGNYPKYLEYIQKALALAKEINYEYGIRFANASLWGYHYEIKDQPEIALQKFYLPGQEAIQKISNEKHKKELQAIYASAIADCYMMMKQYEEAKKYWNQANKINEEVKDTVTDIFIHYNKWILAENKKQYTEAEKDFLIWTDLSEQKKAKYITRQWYGYLADLYWQTWDDKQAYEYRTKQYELTQEINNEISSKTQIELETNIKDKQLIQQKAEIAQQREQEKTLQEQKKRMLWTTIASLIAALGLGSAGAMFYRQKRQLRRKNIEIERQKQKVEIQNNIISKKNNDMKESIDAGKQVQEKIVLSRPEYIKKLFPESFVLFKPRDGVSGDFYRFKETKSGKKLFAAVDCTGHGIPGAFVSFSGSKILDGAVEKGLEKPSDILSYLDDEIISLQKEEGQKDVFAKYGMDIALCSRDETTKTLEYSGAVNPIYIINGDDKQTNVKEIKPNKSKIWYRFQWQKNEYKNDSIHITDPNTIIYLSSDGYQDQFGWPNKKKLKRVEFKKYIEQASKLYFSSKEERNMLDVQKFLEEKFEKRIGDEEQIDDILLMGIKV